MQHYCDNVTLNATDTSSDTVAAAADVTVVTINGNRAGKLWRNGRTWTASDGKRTTWNLPTMRAAIELLTGCERCPHHFADDPCCLTHCDACEFGECV